jgi:hypothetical protein
MQQRRFVWPRQCERETTLTGAACPSPTAIRLVCWVALLYKRLTLRVPGDSSALLRNEKREPFDWQTRAPPTG